MPVVPEVVWSDGQLVTPEDLTAVTKHVNLWLAADLIAQLYGSGEWNDDNAAPHPYSSGATPTDLGGASLRSFGFLGSGLRVTRASSTSVSVAPGWGVQYESAPPSGEAKQRAVRLDAAMTLTLTAASSGHYRRDLIVAKWHDKETTGSAQVLDDLGNVSTSTLTVLKTAEVNDTSPTVQRVQGTEDADATLAPRPAVPSGYVALAEVLVSSTGIAFPAQTNDGATPGVRDLRPRLVPRKAAGAVEARRASCSMDEASAVPSFTRMGAKSVGEVVAHGIVQLTDSIGAVTLDTAHDWRDMMVTVEHGALIGADLVPGGASDTGLGFSTNPIAGGVTLATTLHYSGSGSGDGSGGYFSPAAKTAADGASATLTFFADSTTGALKVRGRTHSGIGYLYFRARGFGPLGKSNLTSREA